jgi:prepilin-type N-terminal cleavage/methylation domain-containing protein
MKMIDKNKQDGFTILEFMIATTVLATILLLATITMITIGNLYYKGFNQARTQDDVRNSVDQITQDIQLSTSNETVSNTNDNIPLTSTFSYPSTYTNSIQAICFGDIRYTYVTGLQLGTNLPTSSDPQIDHVLWRDVMANDGSCVPLNLSLINPDVGPNAGIGHGEELVSAGARLLPNFAISSGSLNEYTITVGITYGNPSLSSPNGICNTDTDDRFCATDTLTSFVIRRSI